MFIRTRGRPKGGAAVELAVVLPLLMFLFVIAIDYARILYYSLTIENCARNGAQFASNIFNNQSANSNSQMPSSYNNSIPQAAIADGVNLNPPLTTANVTVSNGTDANNNPTVTVTVNYTFQTVTNYPGLPSTVNLVRSVTMRYAPQSN
jgi:Flp pilus assembly protein TadG